MNHPAMVYRFRCPNRILTLAVMLVFVLQLQGCLGPVSALYPDEESLRPVTVYVTSHGWHVGIVAPGSAVLAALPDADYPERHLLEFGWGDAGYYPHPDPGLRELLTAALLPTSAVMHIAGFDAAIEQQFPNSRIVQLQLSEQGMAELAAFLANTLKPDNDGNAVFVGRGLYADSIFLEARGPYMLPHTSNLWAARALRAAGVPITPIYAMTQGNVIHQAGRAGTVLR